MLKIAVGYIGLDLGERSIIYIHLRSIGFKTVFKIMRVK